ncbi:MAG: SGNH/GDSL hydrolase family protein, partial [Butyrivibrio sp.]|nr:SGNH/GDSL hydrolase family protein [Butyrivibrio sp.]
MRSFIQDKLQRVATLLLCGVLLTGTGCADITAIPGQTNKTENSTGHDGSLPGSDISANDVSDNSTDAASVAEPAADAEASSAEADTEPAAGEDTESPVILQEAEIKHAPSGPVILTDDALTMPEIVEEASVTEESEAEEEDDKLNVVFLGDSQFANGRSDGTDIASYTREICLSNIRVYNLGIGGTAAAQHRDDSSTPETWSECNFLGMCYILSGQTSREIAANHPAVYEQLNQIRVKDVDYYVIEYGANDYIIANELNNPDNDADPHSFSGALETGIGILRDISPHARFILCGPSYCYWYDGNGNYIGDAYIVSKGLGTLSNYAEISENVAGHNDCIFIDTMFQTFFDLNIITADKYLEDGLHFGKTGRQIYARTVAHFIDQKEKL